MFAPVSLDNVPSYPADQIAFQSPHDSVDNLDYHIPCLQRSFSLCNRSPGIQRTDVLRTVSSEVTLSFTGIPLMSITCYD